jgi:hypothetical protein
MQKRMLTRFQKGDRILGDMWLNGGRQYWYDFHDVDDFHSAPRNYLQNVTFFGDPSLRLTSEVMGVPSFGHVQHPDDGKLVMRPIAAAQKGAWTGIWGDQDSTEKSKVVVRISSGTVTSITDRMVPPPHPKPGPGHQIAKPALPVGAASLTPSKSVTLFLYGAYSKSTGKLVGSRIRYWRAAQDGKDAIDVMLKPSQDPPR